MSDCEWECVSPGLYDTIYKCKTCGEQFTDQIDAGISGPPGYCLDPSIERYTEADWKILRKAEILIDKLKGLKNERIKGNSTKDYNRGTSKRGRS